MNVELDPISDLLYRMVTHSMSDRSDFTLTHAELELLLDHIQKLEPRD